MSKKNKTSKGKKAAKPASASKAKTPSDPDLVPLNEAMKPEAKTKGAKKLKAAKAGKAEQARAPGNTEAKPKKLSCLDAAAQVLKGEGKPMTCKAMIDAMFSLKLWHSDAPTPAATLYSAILREMTKKPDTSRFVKTDRGLFTIMS